MATKKGGKAAASKRKSSDEAAILRSVFQGGRMYNPGDERVLAAAGMSDEVLQNMTDRGLIEGFGFSKAKAAEAESEAEE